jgi:hypothetical protein
MCFRADTAFSRDGPKSCVKLVNYVATLYNIILCFNTSKRPKRRLQYCVLNVTADCGCFHSSHSVEYEMYVIGMGRFVYCGQVSNLLFNCKRIVFIRYYTVLICVCFVYLSH